MQTAGSTYSDVLNEAGRRRPVRPFRVLYKRMAAAEVSSLGGLSRKPSASQGLGWAIRRALRRLPRSVPQAHRWFLSKVPQRSHCNCKVGRGASCGEPLNCCLCSRSSDILNHLSLCQAVLDVFDSIRGVAGLSPISDGRSGLMLQERWEGSVVAGVVVFYAAI